MATIGKWALQLLVLFLFAWLASIVGHWSGQVVSGTSSERLAQLQVLNTPMTAAVSREADTAQSR